MGTDRALLWGLRADVEVPAVAAFPDLVAVAGEHQAALHVLQQLAVTLLVGLLDLAHLLKQGRDIGKALLLGGRREVRVHGGPLVVLARRGVEQVGGRGGNFAAAQQLEPELRVLLLVVGRLLEDAGDLLEALLAGLAGEVGVLVAGLGFPREGVAEVLFGA